MNLAFSDQEWRHKKSYSVSLVTEISTKGNWHCL